MKKVLIYTILLTFFISSKGFVFAQNKTIDEIFSSDFEEAVVKEKTPEEAYEKPILLEPQENLNKKEINPYTKEALKGIIEKNYDLNSTKGMFQDQLRLKIKKGIIKDIGAELAIHNNFTETISDNSNLKFAPSMINFVIDGKFRSEKEDYKVILDLTPNIHDNFMQRLVLDAWVQTKRIPHHALKIGTYRPALGIEGAKSAYVLPFATRSQTARNFADARKTGVNLHGDFKYIDYDIGAFSSDTRYTEFMPGAEGNLWVTFKPLANVKEKAGDLKIGGGVQAGERHSTDFLVASTAIKYDYKNFWMLAEYQNADGSNGRSGLTNKHRSGYNLTLAYRFTKRLEGLLRYDSFDPDKDKIKDDTKEYTAGINYYILGQTLRLMFNYVYCDNKNKSDSHKLIFGSQILL